MSKRVTLSQVASDAGVSRATASLVLRGSTAISAATRERVRGSMRKLGYVYNRAAATLRTQSTHTVGLVMTDIANPFYAELTLGVQERLEQDGYSLILTSTGDDLERQDKMVAGLHEHLARGILICPARGTTADLFTTLRGIPTVLVLRYLDCEDCHYVGADNRRGMRLAAEHLLSLGHRRISFVGGPPDSSARRDRVAGLRDILAETGLQVSHDVITPVSRTGGSDAVAELLADSEPPTAALCYNDIVAIGVMLGLRKHGLEPGQDFSVVGFDDIEEAALWMPPLTTLATQPRELGVRAADLLLKTINDPDQPPETQLMEPELRIRKSTGPPT